MYPKPGFLFLKIFITIFFPASHNSSSLRGVLCKSASIHSNYCTAFWNEWEDLASFGDFTSGSEQLGSTLLQLLNLRYKSGTTTVYCNTLDALQSSEMWTQDLRAKERQGRHKYVRPLWYKILLFVRCDGWASKMVRYGLGDEVHFVAGIKDLFFSTTWRPQL